MARSWWSGAPTRMKVRSLQKHPTRFILGRPPASFIIRTRIPGNPDRPSEHPRVLHTATLLSDDSKNPNYGKVLVTGGVDVLWDPNKKPRPTTKFYSYEIYDSNNPGDGWTCPPIGINMGSASSARAGHAAVRLDDGTVLVVGDIPATYTSEIYQPDTDSWTYTSALNYQRSGTEPRWYAGWCHGYPAGQPMGPGDWRRGGPLRTLQTSRAPVARRGVRAA